MIGIFGGTFDPIHLGHLRSVLELKQRLALDEVRLIPCHLPVHRESPGCNSEQRLRMVELAIAGEPGLVADDRELKRAGPSYTIDTLTALRRELGEDESLCLIMGSDAFSLLDSWHRWQQLLQLAHIVVMARPEQNLPTQGPVADLLKQHRTEDAGHLTDRAAGAVLWCSLTPWPISATAIREDIKAGRCVRDRLPEAVWHYIQENGLYYV